MDYFGYGATDNQIQNSVMSNISTDPYIPPSDKNHIMVSVQGGIVTLSGTVEHRHSRYAAFGDAFWSMGVADIINNIKVSKRDNY